MYNIIGFLKTDACIYLTVAGKLCHMMQVYWI